jgi:lipopolysaccharide transport protein LptA
MDMDSGHGEFFGAPVDLTSPRGRMRAPHVIYTTADQLVHAVEGVRAQIEQANDANLTGSALGEGKGPVLVVSQEAFWRRPQASFVFRGDVRAWRGDNLLLTPELTGERTPQGDQLGATRGVKTVWIPGESASASLSSPPPAASGGAKSVAAGAPAAGTAGNAAAGGKQAATAGAPASGAAAAGTPGAPASTTTIAPAGAKPASGPGGVPHSNGPITVLSTDMVYHDGSGILIYKGNVHVDQDGKTLTCHQLDVYLDVNHKAKQMTCTGDTHFDDPSTGRKIDGESAIYRVEARKVDVVGEVVTMHDRDGNIVHGQRMRYNLDDGKVVVLGKDDGPKVGAAPGGAP